MLVRFPKRSAHFHFVQSGQSTLKLDQFDRAVEMKAGDLVVLTHSRGHCILSHSGADAIDIDGAVESITVEDGLRVGGGGGGEMTKMVCGKFIMNEFTWERTLRCLPDVIHVPADTNETNEWLNSTLGMSRSSFASTFGELVGEAPMSYLMRWRIEIGCRHLQSTDANIAEVASICGYESETTFGRAFKKRIGQTPSE